MKIDRITLTHVRIPLVEPFKISNGEVSEKDAIIIGVHSEGLIGYGEASPMSGGFYSDDTPESTWNCLTEELIPRIRLSGPDSIEHVNAIFDGVPGNSFARAGVETAFWDLEAQKRGLPLHKLLGGERINVESGLAVGIYPSVGALLAAIERYLVEGYKRVKVKIQPGWDVEPLLAVRGEFGRLKLMADANCAYSRNDVDHLKALDDFEMMMIEQPLPKGDLEGHATLQAMMSTPICLDESATDLRTLRKAIEFGSCRIVNIKIQRVGGLKHAKEMHDLCSQAGIPVWGGTMPELGIGGAQTLHLSTLPNFHFPTDVESSKRWFVDDLIEPLLEVRDGIIQIPEGIGNSYKLDQKKVAAYRVREETY
ncbi:MAG TPA: o-succinylbenzoate synthase [Bacteroidetes bacterium]|nr:o-succinylbenzoate synthase [Bacteroidota bacterium]